MKKERILLTSGIILLPILAGAVLWSRLPERVPTHFDFYGEPNGWSGKPFAVFGLPLFLLAAHLACIAAVSLDPKRRNVSGKVFALVLWICPAVSLLAGGTIYAAALGLPFRGTLFLSVFTGALFIVVGNYLPKCRQNYTVGIKLPWTLSDEDNWNRTHRLAGRLWVAGGVLMILGAFLDAGRGAVFLAVLLVLGLAPVVYSAALYLRKRRGEPV